MKATNDWLSAGGGEAAAAASPWEARAMLLGGGVTAVLAVLRHFVSGFWFHPIGFIVGWTSMMDYGAPWGTLLVAWIIRYTTKKLQRILMRWSKNSFYVWGIGLTLAIMLATKALLASRLSLWMVGAIVLVSLACTGVQFWFGRKVGRNPVEKITAGQALGQKNTGFLIWLGYSFMTPVTSVAGGLYAIWQNLFNSCELHEHDRGREIV